MQRPLWSHLFYRLMQTLLLFGGVLFFRIRLRGILREPPEGPVVVVAKTELLVPVVAPLSWLPMAPEPLRLRTAQKSV